MANCALCGADRRADWARIRALREESENFERIAQTAIELVEKRDGELARLESAIVDALADLTPGAAPYGVLLDAFREGSKK